MCPTLQSVTQNVCWGEVKVEDPLTGLGSNYFTLTPVSRGFHSN